MMITGGVVIGCGAILVTFGAAEIASLDPVGLDTLGVGMVMGALGVGTVVFGAWLIGRGLGIL
jgi:hypothetical protein